MTNIDSSDKEIIQVLNEPGSKDRGFTLILEKYQQRLYWHIRKMVISHDDTDDVLQNTFIKIWNGLDKFRGDSSLYTWLYRITTNETLTFLKSKQRKQQQQQPTGGKGQR